MEKKDYKKLVRSAGLKATPQRVVLLELLSETTCHPSAEMLIEMLEKENIKMSVGTIYNVLEAFEEKGLLVKMHDTHQVMRFDANTAFHLHIFDKEKNEIKDYFDDELELLIREHLKGNIAKDLNIEHINLSLYTDKT